MDDDFDFDRAASAFPDLDLDGQGDVPLPSAPAASSGFSFDDFGSPLRQTEIKVTGNDEIEQFEDQFPELNVGQSVSSPAYTLPTFGAPPPFAPRPQPSAFSSTPILNQPLDEDEPEVIRKWRESQVEEIQARDEASKAKRQQTIGKAEHAIDQFYEEYAAKKERTIRENKDEEGDFLESLSSSLTKGTTWERICEIAELQNSQSKTIARAGPGTTDLSRFKEVLLRLKREGTAAPGAAGY
ncbi:clathrin light chain-domain-containing protein [Suillus placidus]|uniref:Clathrin light chain n=1 Tax=Suillus placidus TaxID=48579 RepID=A0A9P7D789_9AGAM|nr:clathrin light chain-domain-containing protein [Suillus placidus]